MACAVIGSGITGLALALFLARQGHAVTVFEAQPHVAPLLSGFSRQGLHFDIGFHVGGGLHPTGLLSRWLKALGVFDLLHGIPEDHCDTFCIGNKTYIFPSGRSRLAAFVARHFPEAASILSAFIDASMAEGSDSPYLNPHLRKPPQGLSFSGLSLTEQFARFPLPPDLQAILATRSLLYGVSPSNASWRDYAMLAGSYFLSAGSWDGGGQALVDACCTRLREAKVSVRTNTPVCGLDADASGVHGIVLADGTRYPCSTCFYTGHPKNLARFLPRVLVRPAYFTKIRELPETSSALLLFGELFEPVFQGNACYLLPNASIDFKPLEEEEPTLCLYRSPKPNQRAVLGICLLDESTRSGQSYAQWKAGLVAKAKAHIEERLPAIRGKWRIVDAATPDTMRRWIHGATGSLFGVSHDHTSVPILPATRIPRFFLAGSNILLPGILGCIVSAAIAVGIAFGHDAVLQEFRQCADA